MLTPTQRLQKLEEMQAWAIELRKAKRWEKNQEELTGKSMNYYKLTFDFEDSDMARVDSHDLSRLEREMKYDGQKLVEEWNHDAVFYTVGEKFEDFLFCPLPGWILVSHKAKKAIEVISPLSTRFLPVKVIKSEDRTEIIGYSQLQIINVVFALNKERTVWLTAQKDQVKYPQLNIIKPVLSAKVLIGQHIFRLGEKTSQTYISELLLSSLKLHNATSGFKFSPVAVE